MERFLLTTRFEFTVQFIDELIETESLSDGWGSSSTRYKSYKLTLAVFLKQILSDKVCCTTAMSCPKNDGVRISLLHLLLFELGCAHFTSGILKNRSEGPIL